MVNRVKLKSITQRKFLDLIVERLNSPSLRGLIQFGFDVKYSALKNYYSGIRLIPLDLFNEIIEISGLSRGDFDFEVVEAHWGQKLGGSVSKRRKSRSA